MMSELAAFLVYCIGMSFTPGPNNLMSLSVSQKVGFKQAAPFLWGLFFSFFIIDGALIFLFCHAAGTDSPIRNSV